MKMVGHSSNLSTFSSMSFELFSLKHETASDRERQRQRQRILNQRIFDFIRVITPCFCFIEPKVMTLQPELLGWLAEARARGAVSRTGASTAASATGNTCARSASVP